MGNVSYYIFVLVAIVVAFLVTSCLIKSAILIAMVVALAAIYFLYLR